MADRLTILSDQDSGRTLTAAELLDVWEAGRELSSLDRTGLLMSAAYPDLSWTELEALPLGLSEAILIRLRESLFGPTMEGLVNCPVCGEQLSFNFRGEDLEAAAAANFPDQVTVNSDGYELALRLPTAADVRAAAGHGQRLFTGLLLAASYDDRPVEPDELPPDVLEEAAAAVEAADPLAHITFGLDCPACQHQWQARFEALSFLWREIEAWAWRTLHAVHALASRYGWREADILAMSAWRRQQYLEMGSG